MSFKQLSDKNTWLVEGKGISPRPPTPTITVCADNFNSRPHVVFKNKVNANTYTDTDRDTKTDPSKDETTYDIPHKRESLQSMVNNLSIIVEKLKKQIEELGDDNTKTDSQFNHM